MKTPQELYKNTRSWGARRKTAKQREGCLRTLAHATSARITIGADPASDTASWAYRNGTHNIKLGTRWQDALLPDAKASERKSYACLQALLLHEYWHGHATERDLPTLAASLRGHGIPFALLNLFEDARIEQKARLHPSFKESFDSGRFGWVNYYEQPKETKSPTQLFWALINGESASFGSLTTRCPEWTGGDVTRANGTILPAGRVVRTIRDFFAQTIVTTTTADLIPILKDWLTIFGNKVDRLPRGSGHIGGESDGSGKEPAGTEHMGGESGHGAGGNSDTAPTTLTQRLPAELSVTTAGEPSRQGDLAQFQNRGVRDEPRVTQGILTPEFQEQVRQQVSRLADIVRRAASAPITRACDGSRLHVANAATGQANAFTHRGRDAGKRKLTVIFDCSGSMGHRHAEHGRAFLLAIVALHRRGTIDADVWLTGGGDRCRLNLRTIDTTNLVAIAPAMGVESYAGTLAAIPLHELRAASAVVCYTDGCISDGNVDAGAYRSKGVNLIGCATVPGGDEGKELYAQKIKDKLRQHFGRFVTAQHGNQLANALVAQITRN